MDPMNVPNIVYLIEMIREIREQQRVLDAKIERVASDVMDRLDNKFDKVYATIEKVEASCQNGKAGLQSQISKINIDMAAHRVRTGWISGITGFLAGLIDGVWRLFHQ